MDVTIFPPFVAQVMLILVGAISLVALVGIAYNYSLVINGREELAKIAALENEVKQLQAEVKEIRGWMAKAQLKEGVPQDKVPRPDKVKPEGTAEVKKIQTEVWQAFIDDYNNLAASMDVPKAAEACVNFVKSHKLQMLICVEPHDSASGRKTPMYAPVDETEISNFWAWPVPGQEEDFVVVPNPLPEYDEKLHNKGGMKETFASNYETGTFHQIQVKLPAHFKQHLGSWSITQPGVIRVK